MRVEQNNSGLNSVQQFSALNAFKSNRNVKQEKSPISNVIEDADNATKAAPKNILEKVDVSDIRKFAEYAGEFNISDDDIKYGLMYGRSVIAEWLC